MMAWAGLLPNYKHFTYECYRFCFCDAYTHIIQVTELGHLMSQLDLLLQWTSDYWYHAEILTRHKVSAKKPFTSVLLSDSSSRCYFFSLWASWSHLNVFVLDVFKVSNANNVHYVFELEVVTVAPSWLWCRRHVFIL